jgi:hypothetical protein
MTETQEAELVADICTRIIDITREYLDTVKKYMDTYPEVRNVLTIGFEMDCLGQPAFKVLQGNKDSAKNLINNLKEILDDNH